MSRAVSHGRTAFISHTTCDDRFVVELKGLIRGLGYAFVFNDADYDSIEPDQEFWPQIKRGIAAADALVVVISAGTGSSRWVMREVRHARRLGKRVLPILIEDCPIPELFRDRDVIDFRLGRRNPLQADIGRPLRAYLARLIEVLDRKQGVLEYVPRTGSLNDSDDDEFGYSVLVKQADKSAGRRMPLAKAIRRHRAVVITGDPGSGKSTTLRRMARVMATEFDSTSGNGSLPILIDLTRWGPEVDLDEAIKNAFKAVPELPQLLGTLNYSVFLDGLNEVTDKQTVERIVRAVCNAAPQVGPIGFQHLILTCRIEDYMADSESLHEKLGLPYITICPLTKREVGAFCQSYLKSAADDLMRFIGGNGLGPLASNAYMLCALIAVYKIHGSAAFPTRAADLFPALTRALWERERKRGYSGTISHPELVAKLAKLAYWMTLEHGFGEVDSGALPLSLDPDRESIALARRCGLLQGTAEGIRFNHQLTQEYLTAVFLKEAQLPGSLRNSVARFRNTFRILGDMDAGHLGARLFGIDPESLADWVQKGVYTTPHYRELLKQLLSLTPRSQVDHAEREALERVVAHDVASSIAIIVECLEQPDRMQLRSLMIASTIIDRLSPQAERTLLHLLDDEQSFSFYAPVHDYYTAAPSTRVPVREWAAKKLFQLGSAASQAIAIDKVCSWLDDSTLVETVSGFSGIGSESTQLRAGNVAFSILSAGPARTDAPLRRTLFKWLETQERSTELAQVNHYSYLGSDGATKTSQAEWARSSKQSLLNPPKPWRPWRPRS